MTDDNTSKKTSDTAAGYGCLFLLGIVGAIGYWAYTGIDSAGWMQHRQDSVITAESNWFVGESKDCTSYPLDEKTAHGMEKPTGYAISKISCDGGPEHSVKITFLGRTEQPDHSWVRWRCTRNQDSFTCKETDASPPVLRSHDVKTGRPILSYDGGKTWEWADQ
jgi:hypothetical protein